jgi:uncharacterized membrane protein
MLTVTLYTRKDCNLCDETRADLKSLQKKHPHRLAEVDIDSDPALLDAYALEIPVVEIGPYKLKAPISRQSLEMTLGAASDRHNQLAEIGGESYEARVRRGQKLSRSDRTYYWLSRHYLALLNLFTFLYVGLPFLAPTLMKAGAIMPARAIYAMYSPLCHQFGFRSFFLFGEQPYYPAQAAGIPGVQTFEQATGITGVSDPASISRLLARQFTGNDTLGYKVALCERDVAIYGGILLFGLVYGLTKRRLPPLHWTAWILIGMGPIGLDGFSQLFSQFNFAWLASVLPYRESTPFLRTLTGLLFGVTTAWFAYPYVEESMRETRQFFLKKFAVLTAAE